MTNVVRSDKTIEDRARFGLGWDTQDDNTEPATTRKQLTAEGVVEDPTIAITEANADTVKATGGGLETVKVVGNAGAAKTLALVPTTDGNVQTLGVDQNTTITMPSGLTSGSAISFTVIATNAGAFTAAFTGVKWAAGTAPTLTSGAGKVDIFSFLTIDGGTTWYGTVVQDVR